MPDADGWHVVWVHFYGANAKFFFERLFDGLSYIMNAADPQNGINIRQFLQNAFPVTFRV